MITASTMTDNKDFINDLVKTQKFMQGEDSDPQLDREGLEAFKKDLSQNSKLIKTRVK